ncbi:rhomboid family intramembrane serine protease [cf. Phormidesmis sp. LEGE 11477]|nr:rhomboid family intramembrane serine protease [cf. Phormidesmis sp. LEGE 11477]
MALVLYSRDPAWSLKLEILRDSLILAWLVSLTNWIFGGSLGQLLGIRPRQLVGLLGIAFAPFLHRDINHLLANTLPFLVLGWLVLLQEGLQGASGFYTVTGIILLAGGLGTWLFGREAIHLGASGLIFGYIGFLLVGSYVVPTLWTVGLAIVVFVLYGAQLWAMLPNSRAIAVSWEGHLFGFVGGLIAGIRPDLLTSIQRHIQMAIDNLFRLY